MGRSRPTHPEALRIGDVKRWVYTGVSAVALFACADSGASPGVTVTDSASVRLVTLEPGAVEALTVYRVGDAPTVSIGSLEGSPEDQLFRVSGATRLMDGRIVVLNAGSQEVRFYREDGSYEGAQGSEGEGPGEYRFPDVLMRRAGDTVGVWDGTARRVTYVGPDREFARSMQIQGELSGPVLAGAFGDGTLLVRELGLPGDVESGYQQLMVDYLRYTSEGVLVDSLVRYPYSRMRLIPRESGSIDAVRMTFDSRSLHAVTSSGVWLGTSRSYEVTRVGLDGIPNLIVRWSGPDLSVTDAVLDALLEERLARAPDEEIRRRIRTSFDLLQVAETLPAYATLVAGDGGRLWIQPYARPGEPTPDSWLVFESDGTPWRSVRLGVGAELLWASGEDVLLLERDELDVEYVRAYRLEPLDDRSSR